MAPPSAIARWLYVLAFLRPALSTSVGAALAIDAIYSPLSFARRALGLGRGEAVSSCATELRIIVSGLSCTGTRSIKRALGSVGHRCYHTDDFISHGHSNLWVNAAAPTSGDAVAADAALRAAVDEVLRLGYDCIVDAAWPHSVGLARLYPSAMVLHSERDSAEEWFNSFYTLNAAFAPAYGRPMRWFVDLRPHDVPLRALGELEDYGNITWRRPLPWVDIPAVQAAEQFQKNRAIFISAYHSQRTKIEAVAGSRLLVFNVKQGWSPLCDFLSLGPACPEGPFPHISRGLDLNFMRLLLEFVCYAYPLVLPFLAFTACVSAWFACLLAFGICLLLRMLAKDFVIRPLCRFRREKSEAAQSRAPILRSEQTQPQLQQTIGGAELDEPRVEARKKDSQVMRRVLTKMREESLQERADEERMSEGYIQRLPAHREDEAEDEDDGIDVD